MAKSGGGGGREEAKAPGRRKKAARERSPRNDKKAHDAVFDSMGAQPKKKADEEQKSG